jgi:hypothetical protein
VRHAMRESGSEGLAAWADRRAGEENFAAGDETSGSGAAMILPSFARPSGEIGGICQGS